MLQTLVRSATSVGARRSRQSLLLTLACTSWLTSCVVVPYRPHADTQHDLAEVEHPELLRLSVGPREFLEKVGEAASKREPRLQPVDGQALIDAAAPDGELTLARLLEPAVRTGIEPLGLDYLVLIGQPETRTFDEKGAIVPYLGFFGATKAKGSTKYWAAVVDARQLRVAEQITSEATGTNAGLGLFYGLFVVSDTEGSARKAEVRHILQTMTTKKPEGPIRVAFLTVERIPTQQQLEVRALERELATPQWSIQQYPAFEPAAPPAEGEALIYVYRPVDDGFPNLTLDVARPSPTGEVLVTRLYQGTYFAFRAAPGAITLETLYAGKASSPLSLWIEPGATQYTRVQVLQQGFWKGVAPGLEPVDEATSASAFRDLRRMPAARQYDLESLRRARLGDGLAQLHVATLYQSGMQYDEGESWPRDPVESYKWLVIHGDRIVMKRAAASMDAAQVDEANRRADEWRRSHEGTPGPASQ